MHTFRKLPNASPSANIPPAITGSTVPLTTLLPADYKKQFGLIICRKTGRESDTKGIELKDTENYLIGKDLGSLQSAIRPRLSHPITLILRILPWPAAGWEYQGRHPSR